MVTMWMKSRGSLPCGFGKRRLYPYIVNFSEMNLREKLKAAGGRWDPEEKLWLVKYGSIAGGPLENHIHIVRSVNQS